MTTIKRTTSNYNLRIPIFDAPGWGRELERNMDIIDAIMFAVSGFALVKGVWSNSTTYVDGDYIVDPDSNTIWRCLVSHTSAAVGKFLEDRTNNPTYWLVVQRVVSNRGTWATGTNYSANDFVVDNDRYGVATTDFTSGASYDEDVSNGYFVTLIDLEGIEATTTTARDQAVAARDLAVPAASAAVDAKNDAESARDLAVSAKDLAVPAASTAVDAKNAAVLAAQSADEDAQSALGYMNEAKSARDELAGIYGNLVGGTGGQVLVKATSTDWDFGWMTLSGLGDMIAAVYDPNAIGADVFDMDNMVEGVNNLIFTQAERDKVHEHSNLATLELIEEAFTTTLKNKLDNIAENATANSSDATLLNRANHTGTQTLATISDAGTAAAFDDDDFATAAQGALADTAVQPLDLHDVAFSGDYDDLINAPVLDPVALSGDYNDLSNKPVFGTTAGTIPDAGDVLFKTGTNVMSGNYRHTPYNYGNLSNGHITLNPANGLTGRITRNNSSNEIRAPTGTPTEVFNMVIFIDGTSGSGSPSLANFSNTDFGDDMPGSGQHAWLYVMCGPDAKTAKLEAIDY